MKENIILSIVIPVYNSGSYLVETFESIKAVKFSYPYEIILVNDGSTDTNTLEILDQYKDIFTVINQKNEGVAMARNRGISEAKGKYILPFDSDDLMNENYYDLALHKMVADNTIDILYGDYLVFGSEKRYNRSGKYNRLRLIQSGCFLPNATIYKKSVWKNNGGYDTNLSYAEDWDFWSRSAVQNYNFFYFDKPLYRYRRIYDGKSLSQTKGHTSTEAVKILKNKIPSSVFTQESISDYVVVSVRENRKLKIKLLLRIFFPRLFIYLQKKKVFPNGIVVE